MKKIIILLLLIPKILLSQELIGTIDINLKDIKNYCQFEDQSNDATVFLIETKDGLNALKTNNKFEVTNKFILKKEDELSDYFGFSTDNSEQYYTYWKKNNKIIEIQTIDFTNKSIQKSEIENPIENNERMINAFSHNNLLHIITATKNSGLLNIYIFNKNSVNKKVVDCSSIVFLDNNNLKIGLWKFITNQNLSIYDYNFQRVYTNQMNLNVVNATNKRKIYVGQNKIILSSDINNNFSQFLTINLTDFVPTSQIISKQDENEKNGFISTQTNSFIINDVIFIAKFGEEQLSILIKNFDNQNIKTFSFGLNEGDAYINSELYEESGSFKHREVLKNKNKFFKHSFSKNPSISGNYIDGKYYLTIAGVSYPRPQSSQVLGVFGFLGGAASAIINDRSGTSISLYSDKNIVYFNSVINNKTFDTDPSKVGNSKLDNARYYLESNTSKQEHIHLFEKNNHYYLISKNEKKDQLLIYRF